MTQSGEVGPRSELYLLGVKLFSWGESSSCPSIHLSSIECSPLEVNDGLNVLRRGQSSPLGAKLIPRGKLYLQGKTYLNRHEREW
jgi:hypothetical protein